MNFAGCRGRDTDAPGCGTDSGARPLESQAHLALVSRIGARCGLSGRLQKPNGRVLEEETKNADERDRGSPVGPLLSRTCGQAHPHHRPVIELRRRHRARVRRAQVPPRPAVRRDEREDADDRRDRRAPRPRDQGVRPGRPYRRRGGPVRAPGRTGLRRARRGDQPDPARHLPPRSGRRRRRHRAHRRGAAAAALPALQGRRQPHGDQLERGRDSQCRHAGGLSPGVLARLRHGDQGSTGSHDARPGRGMGRQGDPLQRHRAAGRA